MSRCAADGITAAFRRAIRHAEVIGITTAGRSAALSALLVPREGGLSGMQICTADAIARTKVGCVDDAIIHPASAGVSANNIWSWTIVCIGILTV